MGRALAIAEAQVWIDSQVGSNANPGTEARPKKSLAAALSALPGGGTVRVRAPEAAPLREMVIYAGAADLELRSWTDGQRWHLYGDTAAAPTVRARSYCLVSRGAGTLLVREGVFRHASIAGLQSGYAQSSPPGGTVEAYDCIAEHCTTGGFRTAAWARRLLLVRCRAAWCDNDGVNVHGAGGNAVQVVMIDCESLENGDEGASPHVDCCLYIYGGRLYGNGNAGVTAIERAYLEMDGAEISGNYRGGGGTGGVWLYGEVAALLRNVLSRDNGAAGFALWPGTRVALIGCESRDNEFPDYREGSIVGESALGKRALIVVLAADRERANAALQALDPDAGAETFAAGLSPDGDPTPTHYWASGQMARRAFYPVRELMTGPEFPGAVFREWDPDADPGLAGALLAELGLQPVRAE